MEQIFVFPGSFSPPTYGHVKIVEEAAQIFPELTVLCSRNPDKEDNLFSEGEAAKLWQSYSLPDNVTVTTFTQFTNTLPQSREIIMIRGVRNESDFETEKQVMFSNAKEFGIRKFFYIIADNGYKELSSTNARRAAQELDFEGLKKSVSPMVITALLEKSLGLKNLFLVVGKPASGKSTFLKLLYILELDYQNIHIDTDEYAEILKPMISRHFKTDDLIHLTQDKLMELKELIKKPWLEMLKQDLLKLPSKTNVFVEIPYGLMDEYHSYSYIGGKILYIGCSSAAANMKRIQERGTPEHEVFVHRIPGKEKSIDIAKKKNLQIWCEDTSGTMKDLLEDVKRFNNEINGG